MKTAAVPAVREPVFEPVLEPIVGRCKSQEGDQGRRGARMDRVPRLLCAALPLLLASSGCQFARSCGWQTSMRPIENCYADCMEHASDLSPIINPDSPLAIDNCRWVRECGPW